MKQDPVALVLGPTGPGPFALLDLPATDVGIPRVLAALHLRLEQVKASPHAATPAAEDVRLALHAAAAQLCDPAVRRLLLGTWATGAAELHPVDDDGGDVRLLIERDLHIAVGLSGGWNAAAMQRLALACEGRGVSLHQLGAVLESIMMRAPAARLGGGQRDQQLGSKSVVDAAAPSTLPRDLVVAIGVAAGLVVCVVAGLITFFGSGVGSASKQDVVAAIEGGAASGPLKLDAPGPVGRTEAPSDLEISDARSIDREIASIAKALASEDATNASSSIDARLRTAFDAFTMNWHLLRREEITAVVSSLIDLSFASAQKQREKEVVGVVVRALGGPPAGRREVRSVVAAGAVAARLLQERDLPRSMREDIESALRGNAVTMGLGPSSRFEVAAEQIVLPLADAIAAGASWADVGTWKGFLDVRDAALGKASRAKDLATIAALRGVLRSVATENADEAIALLAGSMTWEKTSDLRAAIKSWFEDPGVPMARVAALTRAMVKSPLRGVDSTMTLAVTASREERQALGEAFAAVLRDDQDPIAAEKVRAWAVAADEMLAKSGTTPAEAIDLAARMAELIAIRQAQLDGRSDDLSGRFEAAATPTTMPPGISVKERPVAIAGSKAIEYAAIGVPQATRVEFWKKRLTDSGAPDVLLARVAIEEASRGSPAAVRDAARDFVRARSGDEAMLLAAIDLVFAIPESRENLDWLSDVAGRRIAWSGRGHSREAAHRALLEMAAERFPTVGTGAAIDLAAARLAKAWLLRIGESAEDDAVNATDAVRRVAIPMLAIGGRGSEGDVRRRLEARLAIARGGIQIAVWWQAAVVELTAIDIAKRAPGVDVRAGLDAWDAQRRGASTAFEQLLAGERAVLSMLRAEVVLPKGEGT
jgi:hypothetical protein